MDVEMNEPPKARRKTMADYLDSVDPELDTSPGEKVEETKAKSGSVPFYKLFCFADSVDYLLMILGSVGACAHGAAIPVFFIFFGKLIDAFGSFARDSDKMAAHVAELIRV